MFFSPSYDQGLQVQLSLLSHLFFGGVHIFRNMRGLINFLSDLKLLSNTCNWLVKGRSIFTSAHSIIPCARDMIKLFFIIFSSFSPFLCVMRYMQANCLLILTNFPLLPSVMDLSTPVLRGTLFLWTLSRYMREIVRTSLETSMRSNLQQHLALNV